MRSFMAVALPIAFFVSSVGDTNLAKATIQQLREQKAKNPIFLIPLTKTAEESTKDLSESRDLARVLLKDLISSKEPTLDEPSSVRPSKALEDKQSPEKNSGSEYPEQLSTAQLDQVLEFIDKNKIARAYFGVPSTNNETPFQIAERLKIACIIAYEYMFKPEGHVFWKHVKTLADQGNCDFAAPLQPAVSDILALNPKARVHLTGHLSLDQPLGSVSSPASTKEALGVAEKDELVFLSGTTMPIEMDNEFLEALLKELATGKYSNLQLRMGLHPGIKDPDLYLQTLLATCEKYPATAGQFKIILTNQMRARLKSLPSNAFLLLADVSGPLAAQAADKVGQAVPGALLNEAALRGKPSYFHQAAKPYLPQAWFSQSITLFFTAKRQEPHARKELELKETAPARMAKLFQ